ncbi:MAG: Nif3-like dinuclear metal center hexameric protein [Kiritimatiellia bacterium]
MKVETITDFLDRTLKVGEWQDASHNGLQVAGNRPVRRICCGVDASMEFFEAAERRRADMLICHHGISWGDSMKYITGLNYNRVKFLLDRGMALYACHLPLDAHPRYGNNAVICRELGLQRLRKFGWYRGAQIGFAGSLPKSVPYANFKKTVSRILRSELRTMDFGPRMVRTVAVVSGGAAMEVEEAGRDKVDVFITGEPVLAAWHMAREYGVNAIFGGHYATETFGVRALAELLSRRFKIKAEFIDLGIPY